MTDNATKIPLIELYGPVLHGEGVTIGMPTWFVRLGGCDFRCTKCDSMHAVDGNEIKKNATIMSAAEIAVQTLDAMGKGAMATLSGGNPLLWDMTDFVAHLAAEDKLIAVETQGTVYKPWVSMCDFVCISPKGPGMGYGQGGVINQTIAFLNDLIRDRGNLDGVYLKIPVMDIKDLVFASETFNATVDYGVPNYISVGNHWGNSTEQPSMAEIREALLNKMNEITDMVFRLFPEMADVAILPQLHVLQYGFAKGK